MGLKKTLELADVTLLTVTSVDISQAMSALLVSSENIQFGAVKILSSHAPENLKKQVEHILIPPIDIFGYSKFMIEELDQFVDTPYCIVIQADGFIVNPHLWNDNFYKYDYIGAPWPNILGSSAGELDMKKNRVGNGGFSWRSKKLLKACAKVDFEGIQVPIKSEDFLICYYLYENMIEQGIKFAPYDIAKAFSREITLTPEDAHLNDVFGFHGRSWLTKEYLHNLFDTTALKNELESLVLIDDK